MKTHLPLLLRKALLSCFAPAVLSAGTVCSEAAEINNHTTGVGGYNYYNHDIYFYYEDGCNVELIGNGQYNEDPDVEWSGGYDRIMAYGVGEKEGTYDSDIYVDGGITVQAWQKIHASDSIIITNGGKLLGALENCDVDAKNSVYLAQNSELTGKSLTASTFYATSGGFATFVTADIGMANEYRSGGLTYHWMPVVGGWYDENAPCSYDDSTRFCSIYLNDKAMMLAATLTTVGNVYLRGKDSLLYIDNQIAGASQYSATIGGDLVIDGPSRVELAQASWAKIEGNVGLYDNSIFSLSADTTIYGNLTINSGATVYAAAGFAISLDVGHDVILGEGGFFNGWEQCTVSCDSFVMENGGYLAAFNGSLNCGTYCKLEGDNQTISLQSLSVGHNDRLLLLGNNLELNVAHDVDAGSVEITETTSLTVGALQSYQGIKVTAASLKVEGNLTNGTQTKETTDGIFTDIEFVDSEVTVGGNFCSLTRGLRLTDSVLSVGGETHLAGDLLVDNGEGASSLTFGGNAHVKGNLVLYSGKVMGSSYSDVSLTVGKDATLRNGASLTGGQDLTVGGALVIEAGCTFDGFSGNVSAKNMELSCDISFTGENRTISTTESLHVYDGDLSFSGSGVTASVGKNLEFDKGKLTVSDGATADIHGDLINNDGVCLENDATVSIRANLNAKDVSLLKSALTVSGETNLKGNLTAEYCKGKTLAFGSNANIEGNLNLQYSSMLCGADNEVSLTVGKGIALEGTSSLSVSGNLTAKSVSIQDATLTVGGETHVDGSLTVENSMSDALTFNGNVNIGGSMNVESGVVNFMTKEDGTFTVGQDFTLCSSNSILNGKGHISCGSFAMQNGGQMSGFSGSLSSNTFCTMESADQTISLQALSVGHDDALSVSGNNLALRVADTVEAGSVVLQNHAALAVEALQTYKGINAADSALLVAGALRNGAASPGGTAALSSDMAFTDSVITVGGELCNTAGGLSLTRTDVSVGGNINVRDSLSMQGGKIVCPDDKDISLTVGKNLIMSDEANISISGNLSADNVSIQTASSLTVNGETHLEGDLKVGDMGDYADNSLVFHGDIYTKGCIDIRNSYFAAWHTDTKMPINVSADGGLTLINIDSPALGEVTVNNQGVTAALLDTIRTIKESGAGHDQMVTDIIGALDGWNRAGITLDNTDLGTEYTKLFTSGNISISGPSLYGVSIEASSENLLSSLFDTIGATLLPDIKPADRGLTAAMALTDAYVQLHEDISSNGEITIKHSYVTANSLYSKSSLWSSVSITNDSMVELGHELICTGGTLEVENSVLRISNHLSVVPSETALALLQERGWEYAVSFKGCSEVSITNDFLAAAPTLIDNTVFNAKRMVLITGSDLTIANGSNVTITEDLSSSGNVSIADSTLSVGYGLSIHTSELGNSTNLTIQSSSLTVGRETNVAGDVTIANGEDNSLAFNADVTVGGNVNLQSGKLHFDAENKVSLTVGKDLTLGDGASLAGGVNLAVTGNLVMQQGSAFDGFSGNVSAKNMQLRGDLSFAGANRRISTTENLQMNGGDLSFSESGMVVSVGKNLEVKNGGLSFNAVKADIGGDLVNQSAIGTKNSIAVDIKNGADVHVKGNLTGTDVTVLAADLTVDGKTNLDGNLTAWNGDSNALSFGDAVYTEGCIDVHGGLFTTWNKAGDSAAAITAVNGLTLTNVKQGQLGDVTVDNQSAASDIVATIGAVIAGGGIWGEVVAQVIGIIDDWNRSGITLTNSDVQSLGTLSTSGEIAISGGTYTGVELNADSESLISDIIHIIDKVMLPEIKLGERGVTAAVTLTDTAVSLSGQIYSNGNLSVENTVLSAKNMKSTSSELAAVSISNGSTVTLEDGLESSGAVSVENSVLRMGGDFSVDATDVAISILESLGLVDVVSFVDCEEISIGGTFSSNSSTYISNTTLTAKEMELASEWIASDLRIVNGSKVSIAGAIRNEGSILIDGSTVSVGKGISTDEPTFRPEFSVATDIIINNHATVEVKGAVESADDLDVTGGSLLIVHNLKAENGETAASGDVVAADNVLVDTAEIRAAGNFSAGKEVTVKGEGAKLSVGGNTTIGDLLHIEDKAIVNLNGQANINLPKLEMVNGLLNLLNADGTVPATAYNLVLNELAVEGNLNTVEANLIICDNATLTFSEGALLSMGCDVTLGSGTALNLEGDYAHTLIALFAGVDSLTLAGEAITHDGLYDAYGTIGTLNGDSIDRGQYVIGYRNGVVSFGAGTVPEPATATLSLLALAALTARRRRK